jgi:hypothetical protein
MEFAEGKLQAPRVKNGWLVAVEFAEGKLRIPRLKLTGDGRS